MKLYLIRISSYRMLSRSLFFSLFIFKIYVKFNFFFVLTLSFTCILNLKPLLCSWSS